MQIHPKLESNAPNPIQNCLETLGIGFFKIQTQKVICIYPAKEKTKHKKAGNLRIITRENAKNFQFAMLRQFTAILEISGDRSLKYFSDLNTPINKCTRLKKETGMEEE
ncbi:hypothetical protein CDAR_215171 [Caerostris darwini]|uniref:LAGLIDADG homing endonuclease n=1 Tax=Caerostris darwini TaxID=1538125 RepID=A0AAV4RXU3_9ARAC|nr:hypothetical protein CDAR_215171 [Caerostris darwini]